MESVTERFEATRKALKKLHKNLKILEKKSDPIIKEYYEEFRNSAIQTFEFSIDTFWKLIKDYIDHKHGVVIPSPNARSIFREAINVKIIEKSELDILYDMVSDRNVTSHTYNEFLAEDIANRLPKYYQLMHAILERIKL